MDFVVKLCCVDLFAGVCYADYETILSETEKEETGGKRKHMNQKLHTVIGILAHVDAGKTTLSEGILYKTGVIRKAGRVDHGDAFLDTDTIERQRGITIFSKQAEFSAGGRSFTLLDTPGHVDFSPEMERTLQVLDAAVLVISAPEGINGRVRTLWKLLEHYQVPVILFVNKMDQAGADRSRTLAGLQKQFGGGCIDFQEDLEGEAMQEQLAVCDEAVLEAYLEGEPVGPDTIARLVMARKIYPCYFGAALQMEGVDDLLEGLAAYAGAKAASADFEFPADSAEAGEAASADFEFPAGSAGAGEAASADGFPAGGMAKSSDRPAGTTAARVFKISRDAQGTRLTWIRLLKGKLRVKEAIMGSSSPREEKIDQIRIYSGERYELVQTLEEGRIAALTGLTGTFAGQGLGAALDLHEKLLQPVYTSAVIPSEPGEYAAVLQALRILEEEEPLLQVSVNEETREMFVGIMGEVQTEILRQRLQERFSLNVRFADGRIAYRETIADTVEGVGHFEPLRHYAEVHLLLEPGEPGSGMTFEADCSTDHFALNWQRLVLTHLEERSWQGVLTGSDLTDIKITLIAGRAHEKHTEGGDFRQATYRAVRQGLMEAKSILLEPVYSYEIRVPADQIGRAMTDIERMGGKMNPPETDGADAVLTGLVPASEMQGYQTVLTSYSGGHGEMTVNLHAYLPCHNAAEVIEVSAYDPDADLANPSSSVFCYHGAGALIPWDQVRSHMHLDTGWRPGMRRQNGRFVNPGQNPADADGARDAYGIHGAGSEASFSYEGDLQAVSARQIQAARQQKAEAAMTFKEREQQRGAAEQELKEIFERTYGAVRTRSGRISETLDRTEPEEEIYDQSWREYRRRQKAGRDTHGAAKERRGSGRPAAVRPDCLLVDGYNIIFAWEELRALARKNIDAARDALMDILSDYQGYEKCTLILVFDAYKVRGGERHIFPYHNINVVYTKEAETADSYIEKTVHELARNFNVTVATSDGLEQMIILGEGASRMSAQELEERIRTARGEARETFEANRETGSLGRLLDQAPPELAAQLEAIRRGRK